PDYRLVLGAGFFSPYGLGRLVVAKPQLYLRWGLGTVAALGILTGIGFGGVVCYIVVAGRLLLGAASHGQNQQCSASCFATGRKWGHQGCTGHGRSKSRLTGGRACLRQGLAHIWAHSTD